MKLLSALSVNTVFGLQVFLVISKINMEFLNHLFRKTMLSFMGIADFILADEGDLYMNEYHMLAHIIIRNNVDDFGTICSRLYSIRSAGLPVFHYTIGNSCHSITA